MAVTWNPADKNIRLTLSNGNLTVTHTGTYANALVRATESKSSGKWYWEIENVSNQDTTQAGVATSGASVNLPVGYYISGWAYQNNGYKYNNNIGSTYGASFTTNDIIGIALDLDNGKIWWSKNGVWQASGDPGAGTNEAYSGISGDIFPAISTLETNESWTAGFKSSDFSYTIPSGFEAYDSGTIVDVPELILNNTLSSSLQYQLPVSVLSSSNSLEISDIFLGYSIESDIFQTTNSLDSDTQIGIDTDNLNLLNSISVVPTIPIDSAILSLTNILINPNILIVTVVSIDALSLTNSLSSTLKNQIYLSELTLSNAISSSPQIQLDTPNLILTNNLISPNIFYGKIFYPDAFQLANSLDGNIQIGLYSEILSLTNSLSSSPQMQLFSQVFELISSIQEIDIVQFTTEHADVYYLFTLTGAADSTTDIEIPIKSFQGRLRQGDPSYLSLVIPGIDYSDEIIARSNGDLVIDMAYKQAGQYIQREEIACVTLEDIRIDQGANNQSISLSGHKTETYSTKTVNISMSPTYYGSYRGKVHYRFPTAMIDLHPGDTAVVGVDSFEIGNITYTIGVATQTMELTEA